MASTGCACCAPATAADPAPPAAFPASSTERAAYPVEGMTCGHCADGVTEAVTALEGVADVHIDLVAGGVSTVTVTGSAAPEAVRTAIEEAGYTPAAS